MYIEGVFALLTGLAMSLSYQARMTPGKGFTIAQADGTEAKVTQDNTLNGTYHSNFTRLQAERIEPLSLTIVNNFDAGPINAYIQGLDSKGAVVFITANGSLIYPSSHGSRLPLKIDHDLAIPLPRKGKSLNMKIPIPLSSGRVDGRGYAFSYDDVNPDGTEDASGLVASGNPDTLTVKTELY
ncbi:glycoside hydrolase family 64 protein [Trichoderma longibrachiatum ATCC 18648]|uniref:Glycoside hydrolase family 64 protein n=1 Tax=Trichoderma longibrachiatum ATCC 18648 TaxID=983965 RepID=A0A2T4C0V3_TRILO|nr:glycoside hydrolase family 64 protein [Trichoderma longibrachiatum ATCC 18648]